MINKPRNVRELRQKRLISCFHKVQCWVGEALGSIPSIWLGCHLNRWLPELPRQRTGDQFFIWCPRGDRNTFHWLCLVMWPHLTLRELWSEDLCVQEGEQDWVWVSTARFYYTEEAVHLAGVESRQWLESDGTDTQQGKQKS